MTSSIDVQSLRVVFADAGMKGTVLLIDSLAADEDAVASPIQIGSSTIIDRDGLLDEITVLFEKRFGIPNEAAYAHENLRLKPLYIGRPRSRDKTRAAISVWEWFSMFAQILPDISEPSWKFFDQVANEFAKAIKTTRVSADEFVEQVFDKGSLIQTKPN